MESENSPDYTQNGSMMGWKLADYKPSTKPGDYYQLVVKHQGDVSFVARFLVRKFIESMADGFAV